MLSLIVFGVEGALFDAKSTVGVMSEALGNSKGLSTRNWTVWD